MFPLPSTTPENFDCFDLLFLFACFAFETGSHSVALAGHGISFVTWGSFELLAIFLSHPPHAEITGMRQPMPAWLSPRLLKGKSKQFKTTTTNQTRHRNFSNNKQKRKSPNNFTDKPQQLTLKDCRGNFSFGVAGEVNPYHSEQTLLATSRGALQLLSPVHSNKRSSVWGFLTRIPHPTGSCTLGGPSLTSQRPDEQRAILQQLFDELVGSLQLDLVTLQSLPEIRAVQIRIAELQSGQPHGPGAAAASCGGCGVHCGSRGAPRRAWERRGALGSAEDRAPRAGLSAAAPRPGGGSGRCHPGASSLVRTVGVARLRAGTQSKASWQRHSLAVGTVARA